MTPDNRKSIAPPAVLSNHMPVCEQCGKPHWSIYCNWEEINEWAAAELEQGD